MYTGRNTGTIVYMACTQSIVSNAECSDYIVLLSVLKSHYNRACIGLFKQLLSKSEKRFVRTHWLQASRRSCEWGLFYLLVSVSFDSEDLKRLRAYQLWSLISNEPHAVKHEGFRHCSGVVVAREVGWCLLKFDSFNIKICKELNDLCELQTHCVLYVVFTRQSS